MPLQERDDAAVDPRLEKATEFANKALDREPAERTEAPEPREAKKPVEQPSPRELIDKITFPAHERVISSRRDREIQARMEAMERKLLEKVEALVPKPAPPQEPDFQTDPVAWQEWRDQQFKEGLVEEIVSRVSPPKDPEQERFVSEQQRALEEVNTSMRDYVESTFQAQGYGSPAEAWDGMQQRAQAYQALRLQEIMQERHVDARTAEAWRNAEIARDYRWAQQNGRDPIALLDGLAMEKIAQYAGSAGAKATVDEDARERQKASSSSMAGGIGTAAAPRATSDKPLTRMSLKDVPRDRRAYRELIAKNRQPGETLEAANRRVRTQILKASR